MLELRWEGPLARWYGAASVIGAGSNLDVGPLAATGPVRLQRGRAGATLCSHTGRVAELWSPDDPTPAEATLLDELGSSIPATRVGERRFAVSSLRSKGAGLDPPDLKVPRGEEATLVAPVDDRRAVTVRRIPDTSWHRLDLCGAASSRSVGLLPPPGTRSWVRAFARSGSMIGATAVRLDRVGPVGYIAGTEEVHHVDIGDHPCRTGRRRRITDLIGAQEGSRLLVARRRAPNGRSCDGAADAFATFLDLGFVVRAASLWPFIRQAELTLIYGRSATVVTRLVEAVWATGDVPDLRTPSTVCALRMGPPATRASRQGG